GGAGYVEDTGLPMLLRDSQVLPIWEGTTNVLALDTLRALAHADAGQTTNDEGRASVLRPSSSVPRGLAALRARAEAAARAARDTRLALAGRAALTALADAEGWLREASRRGQGALDLGARRFVITLGRALELALLVEHAQWSLDHERDGRA